MSHATAENFRISMSLSLQGIGAELRSEDDYTIINRTLAGGPAEAGGLIGAEDKSVGVAQDGEEMIDVIGWRLRYVVKLIRGDKSTQITLNVIDADIACGSEKHWIVGLADSTDWNRTIFRNTFVVERQP